MKRLLAILKYPIALALLYWVLHQLDLALIADDFRSMPLYWALLAFAAFGVAQLCAVARMNAYYAHAGRPISFPYGLKLHYVALFYNIILPGGIGGDGYKVYQLHKQAAYPVKEGIKIQILTRLNGLLVLGFTLCATFALLPVAIPYAVPLALVVALAGAGTYAALLRYLFKASLAMEWRALGWSAGVQGCNVLCMLALWHGLMGNGSDVEAIFLFQLAAVAGMIPVTIGGLGVRELTFFYGAELLGHLDAEGAVAVSLLVFAITVAHALIGLFWMGRMDKLSPQS